MNISAVVEYLHASASFGDDYIVQDDGQGPYISHWDESVLGPQPTQAELEAVWPEYQQQKAKTERIAEIESELRRIDLATMRPLRAIQTGNDIQLDHDILHELEQQAQTLRAELWGLKNA